MGAPKYPARHVTNPCVLETAGYRDGPAAPPGARYWVRISKCMASPKKESDVFEMVALRTGIDCQPRRRRHGTGRIGCSPDLPEPAAARSADRLQTQAAVARLHG